MRHIINRVSRFWLQESLGLLLIRIALGLLFLAHGWSKVHNLGGTEAMFMHMGFPAWIGFCIAWLEVVGGLALILGIATRLFAVAFGIEMLVAVAIGNLSHALGGVELLLALASFGLAVTGGGRFSLYPMQCRECGAMLCSDHG